MSSMLLPRALTRRLLGAVVTVAVAYGLATAIRYGLVERDDLGSYCDVAAPAWWCGVRMLVIRGFLYGVFGYASIALAALASWRRSPWLAYGGLGIGTVGMVLYGFTWSGVGVVASALVLARLQGEWPEHGQSEQHAG
jgi:hypothetical protein